MRRLATFELTIGVELLSYLKFPVNELAGEFAGECKQ